MCRSIKTLRTTEGAATPEEVEAAALQFVRKVSGMRDPAPRNADAFNQAVAQIAEVSRALLESLPAKRSVAKKEVS